MARLVTGRSTVAAPRDAGGPLRILVVQGEEDGPGLGRLDLAAELGALTRAWKNLDAAVKALVPPIDVPAVRDGGELARVLAKSKPSLLWLSGHARNDPPGFLLADGSWLSPDDLAAAVRDAAQTSGVVPLYVVLWACKTGLQERFAAPKAAPPFIAALAAVGVSAVLATLGPLADDVAPDFAGVVLGSLAVGRPLDHAVARGRAALMATQLPDGRRDDWACPVVWCVDLPAGGITWSADVESGRCQDLARRILGSGPEPAEPDATALAQAETWSRHDRVWVIEPTNLGAAVPVRSEWLARVLAQQRFNDRMVLTVDFEGKEAVDVLRKWADEVLGVVDGFDDPDGRFRSLLASIRNNPATGWRELCRRGNVTVAMISPSEGDQDGWLWEGLRGAPVSAVVLARSFPPWGSEQGWAADELRVVPDGAPVDPVGSPLAPGLAVLAHPAAAQDLNAIDAAQFERLKGAGFLIWTRAGWSVPLSRAASVADRLNPADLAAAHRRAFQMLDGSAARAKVEEGDEARLKARLVHARAGGDSGAKARATQQLMGHYRAHRRAYALRVLAQETDFRAIDESWKVAAAWAQLATGHPDAAYGLLEFVHDDELVLVDRVDRLVLMAEAEKSSGRADSKTRARQLLEKANSVLAEESGADAGVARLRIDHDLARLTHFVDRDPAAAIPLYEAVSDGWEIVPGHALEQAITLRNLAEAEMMVADRGVPDAADRYRSAGDHLVAARDRLKPNWGHPVVAELEYLVGRLATRDGRTATEATACFVNARSESLRINHMMLVAIVEARLFWRRIAAQPADEYDPGGWDECVEALSDFDRHGWAVRVLVDGHLRSARRLLDGGLARPADTALRAARTLLEANPAFDAGSDRDRIVATWAGLTLTGKDQVPWDELRTRFEWFDEWAADRTVDTPDKAWEATR